MRDARNQYAKDRDSGFAAFIEDGDFAHIDALTEKYGLAPIPHTDTGAAGIYKAAQECVHLSDKTKAKAFAKCTELGFWPWMEVY